jgi:hypothetical protein
MRRKACQPVVCSLVGFVTCTGLFFANPSANAQTPWSTEPADRSKPHLENDRLDNSFCRYPPIAVREGIEGCCRMTVEVGATGRAGKMTGECTHQVFLEPSMACLVPQTYLPALKNDKPVGATGDIVVEYWMGEQSSPILDFLSLFQNPKSKPQPKPEPELCKSRPGDLISDLERFYG